MNWVDTPNGKRHCKRHGTTIEIGELCSRCVADPGPAPGNIDTEVEPLSDLELARAARVVEYQALSKALHRRGGKLIEGTDREGAVGVKLIAEGTKLARLVEELSDKALDHEHDIKLIRHEREMAGLRGSH